MSALHDLLALKESAFHAPMTVSSVQLMESAYCATMSLSCILASVLTSVLKASQQVKRNAFLVHQTVRGVTAEGVCLECFAEFFLHFGGCLTECPVKFVADEDNNCIPCPENCDQCTVEGICLNCAGDLLILEGECVESCPERYVKKDDECIDCPPDCMGCTPDGGVHPM